MIPILFENKFISLQTLWFFVVIALLVGSYLTVKRLKRRRVDFNLFIQHSTSFIISSLFFSRTIYFFTNTDAYFPAFDLRTLWNFISIWDQGLSLWGAVLGFTLMLSYRLYRAKEEIWKWYDSLVIPALIGYCIGLVGAFLGGFAYGKPTELPWGVTYQIQNVKYTVPVHPIQIYAIIAVTLLLLSKKRLKDKTEFFNREGNTTIYLSTGFSLIYFLLEFLKGDDTLLIQGIRIPMIIAAMVFITSGIALAYRYKSFKNEST